MRTKRRENRQKHFIGLGGTGAAAADWRFETAAETESRNAVAWVENAEGFRFSLDGSRFAVQRLLEAQQRY